MIATDVIDFSVLHQASPAAPRRSRKAMVDHMDVGKAHAGPAQHVGLHLIHRVRTRTYPQTADCVPTCLPVDLYTTTHMKHGMTLQHFLSTLIVIENAAANSDFGILPELPERRLKVVRFERQVAVEL